LRTPFQYQLLPGKYTIRAHALDPEGLRLFDTVETSVRITGQTRDYGLCRLEHKWLPEEKEFKATAERLMLHDSAMRQADSTEIKPLLVVSGMASEYEAGQLLEINMDLAIRDICLFNPVLRLFIRRIGENHTCWAPILTRGGCFILAAARRLSFYPWLAGDAARRGI